MEDQSAAAGPKNRPVKIIWDLPHPAHEPAEPAS
jgi:hypothetical protein